MTVEITVITRQYICSDYTTSSAGNMIRHLVDRHGVALDTAKLTVYMTELQAERTASEQELNMRRIP